MSDTNNVSHWIQLVKQGNSAAANRLWQHYFDRLVRTVRGRLAGQNRAVSDEEDIVLSVFESFYAAAEQGRFPDLGDRDDLWRLLLRMSARKAIDKRRHDQRQRRGESWRSTRWMATTRPSSRRLGMIHPRNGADDAGIRRRFFFSSRCRAAPGIGGCQIGGVFKRRTRPAIQLF